jgi:hypothetical protein
VGCGVWGVGCGVWRQIPAVSASLGQGQAVMRSLQQSLKCKLDFLFVDFGISQMFCYNCRFTLKQDCEFCRIEECCLLGYFYGGNNEYCLIGYGGDMFFRKFGSY